ncbi:thioredoxin family protein [Opitutus sp. GAS368]|jgi:thiol-disulfide isomerase/thioredoxin|uniref:TlpA family protein disulfide reductase n=1 Tax=Opitutus sp. GAS368 TaxID=1882749 RepID=UPI00087B6E6A|nr:thioredoxin family protein [Opitutus sp. GAS368]SDR74125.1 Thioredoxin [Opitutus sp. GAS368]
MKSLLATLCSLAFASAAVAADTHAKGAEPAHISQGQTVNLADYVVPGKTTIFDFTSKYCGPCQAYNEPLAQLHRQREDVAVVKVDINRPEATRIDWQSPVAQEFGLHSIPHFKVYGPDGTLIAEDKLVIGPDGRPTSRDAKGRDMVNRMIEQLK